MVPDGHRLDFPPITAVVARAVDVAGELERLLAHLQLKPDFHYVADHNAPKETGDALAQVLGEGVRVNAFRRKFLQPGSSGKFSLLKPLAK